MVDRPIARCRARAPPWSPHLLHGALSLPEFAGWLAAHAREMGGLDDPALWMFADAVQAAANRVARGELAAPEATAELLALAEARRFLRP